MSSTSCGKYWVVNIFYCKTPDYGKKSKKGKKTLINKLAKVGLLFSVPTSVL